MKCPRGKRPYKKRNPLDRFWAKVEKTPTCWLWTGAIQKADRLGHGGYGQFRLDDKTVGAHVFAYENLVGPTNGKQVLHHCDVRHCVYPSHLFLGDNQANTDDAVSKGRHPRGETNGRHKLTEKEVLEIRFLHSQGFIQRVLAKEYGVQWSAIWSIVHRKTWRHI